MNKTEQKNPINMCCGKWWLCSGKTDLPQGSHRSTSKLTHAAWQLSKATLNWTGTSCSPIIAFFRVFAVFCCCWSKSFNSRMEIRLICAYMFVCAWIWNENKSRKMAHESKWIDDGVMMHHPFINAPASEQSMPIAIGQHNTFAV